MSETKILANKETIVNNKAKSSSHHNVELSPSPQSNTLSEESPKITVGKPPLPPFSRQSKKESQILEGSSFIHTFSNCTALDTAKKLK
jgi:hypothetical protein